MWPIRSGAREDEPALALYQNLAAVDRAHCRELARTLQNRRCQPAGPGRNQQALGAKEEALALYRNLAAANPDLYEKTYQRLV